MGIQGDGGNKQTSGNQGGQQEQETVANQDSLLVETATSSHQSQRCQKISYSVDDSSLVVMTSIAVSTF